MNRRQFLATTAAALAAPALVRAEEPAPKTARVRYPLAISTYSYWHFRTEKVTIEKVIDATAALGVEGADILHRQMDIEELGPLTAGCMRIARSSSGTRFARVWRW